MQAQVINLLVELKKDLGLKRLRPRLVHGALRFGPHGRDVPGEPDRAGAVVSASFVPSIPTQLLSLKPSPIQPLPDALSHHERGNTSPVNLGAAAASPAVAPKPRNAARDSAPVEAGDGAGLRPGLPPYPSAVHLDGNCLTFHHLIPKKVHAGPAFRNAMTRKRRGRGNGRLLPGRPPLHDELTQGTVKHDRGASGGQPRSTALGPKATAPRL